MNRDSTVWDFKMWPLAVSTSDRISDGYYKEMVGRFAWPKYRGRNNGP